MNNSEINRPKALMTAKEVAVLCHCNPNQIRYLAKLNVLKGIHFSKKTIYFRPEEVDSFLNWCQGKDLSNPDNIIDLTTNQTVIRL